MPMILNQIVFLLEKFYNNPKKMSIRYHNHFFLIFKLDLYQVIFEEKDVLFVKQNNFFQIKKNNLRLLFS